MENKVLLFERDNVREIRMLRLRNATAATPRSGSLLYKVKNLACAVLAMAVSAMVLCAGEMSVKMLPSENWWGLCNNFGSSMPFAETLERVLPCQPERDDSSATYTDEILM